MLFLHKWMVARLGRQIILTYFFIVLIPIALVAWIGDSFYRSTFEKNISSSTQLALEQLALNVQNYFSGLLLFTDMVATDSELQKNLESIVMPIQTMSGFGYMSNVDRKLDTYKQQIKADFVQSGVFLKNGFMTKRADRYNLNYPDLDEAGIDRILQQMGKSQTVMEFNSNSNVNAMFLYKKILLPDSAGGMGILRLADSKNKLDTIIKGWSDKASKVVLLKQDGGVVYDPMPDQWSFVGRGMWESMLRDTGAQRQARFGGKPYLLLNKPIFGDYYIGAIISYNDWLMPINRIRTIIMIVACFLLIVATAVYTYINYRIVNPISRLISLHNQVQYGNLKVRFQSSRQDEIGLLGNSFNRMTMEIETLLNKVLRTQLKEKEAKLNYLYSQIKPHFLYNTLESINMLAIIHRAAPVSEMVTLLGKFYRLTTGKHLNDSAIKLEEEAEMARCYTAIQQIRFGSRLKVNWELDEDCLNIRCPKIILQPIIENAIFHGLEPKLGDGTLTIRAERLKSDEQDLLRISIRDDGIGISEEKLKLIHHQLAHISQGNSVGIQNVHERIRLFYGAPYGMEMTSSQGAGTNVTLLFPALEDEEAVDDRNGGRKDENSPGGG